MADIATLAEITGRALVLKSGSFGSLDFFARAFDHLNEAIS